MDQFKGAIETWVNDAIRAFSADPLSCVTLSPWSRATWQPTADGGYVLRDSQQLDWDRAFIETLRAFPSYGVAQEVAAADPIVSSHVGALVGTALGSHQMQLDPLMYSVLPRPVSVDLSVPADDAPIGE